MRLPNASLRAYKSFEWNSFTCVALHIHHSLSSEHLLYWHKYSSISFELTLEHNGAKSFQNQFSFDLYYLKLWKNESLICLSQTILPPPIRLRAFGQWYRAFFCKIRYLLQPLKEWVACQPPSGQQDAHKKWSLFGRMQSLKSLEKDTSSWCRNATKHKNRQFWNVSTSFEGAVGGRI